MVMPYHLHMPSYFLETFTEYPYIKSLITSICVEAIQGIKELFVTML